MPTGSLSSKLVDNTRFLLPREELDHIMGKVLVIAAPLMVAVQTTLANFCKLPPIAFCRLHVLIFNGVQVFICRDFQQDRKSTRLHSSHSCSSSLSSSA